MGVAGSPMVAVRSTGLSLDSIIGYEDSTGNICSLVDENYLCGVVEVANMRFAANYERMDRFKRALLAKDDRTRNARAPSGDVWEDAASRRERKRREGQVVQQNLHSARGVEPALSDPEDSDMLLGDTLAWCCGAEATAP